jgi:predicted trehalose synthase
MHEDMGAKVENIRDRLPVVKMERAASSGTPPKVPAGTCLMRTGRANACSMASQMPRRQARRGKAIIKATREGN